MINLKELHGRIDQDSGLKSKKNILNITSIILLAIQFTGAEIIEANTFILKLKFEHQNGIALLLALTVSFFLLRYYNYAKPYHNELYAIWSGNLLNDSAIDYHCPHSDKVSGLLHEKHPKGFDINTYLYQESHSNLKFNTSYECKIFLVRYFCFTWDNEYETSFERINVFKAIGFRKYISVLAMEFKYQFSRYFTHRENLDILAPYFLGSFAISSYIFNNQFNSILSYLLGV